MKSKRDLSRKTLRSYSIVPDETLLHLDGFNLSKNDNCYKRTIGTNTT